jgi:hypothetical protein
VVVGVDDVNIAIIDEVSFMAVALMRVKVNDEHPANAFVLTSVVHNESDVREYAEPTALRACCVVIPA